MKSSKSAERKRHRRSHARGSADRRDRRLLSVRSALILELALLTALGGAGLLYLAHRSPVQIVLSGIGTFAVAVKLFDSTIE